MKKTFDILELAEIITVENGKKVNHGFFSKDGDEFVWFTNTNNPEDPFTMETMSRAQLETKLRGLGADKGIFEWETAETPAPGVLYFSFYEGEEEAA